MPICRADDCQLQDDKSVNTSECARVTPGCMHCDAEATSDPLVLHPHITELTKVTMNSAQRLQRVDNIGRNYHEIVPLMSWFDARTPALLSPARKRKLV